MPREAAGGPVLARPQQTAGSSAIIGRGAVPQKEKAPPSLARRRRLDRWAWGNSRWRGRRWSSYIPFSEKILAIGTAKNSALAYATNQHGCGGQEQSSGRNPHHPILLRELGERGPVSKRAPSVASGSSCRPEPAPLRWLCFSPRDRGADARRPASNLGSVRQQFRAPEAWTFALE